MNTKKTNKKSIKNIIETLILTTVLCLSSLLLSACGSSIALESKNFPSEALAQVELDFKQRFSYGDWRYQGIENAEGRMQALIQIPAKLALSTEQQEKYIRATICPSLRNNSLWQSLKGNELSVKLYISTKTSGIAANCHNPLV